VEQFGEPLCNRRPGCGSVVREADTPFFSGAAASGFSLPSSASASSFCYGKVINLLIKAGGFLVDLAFPLSSRADGSCLFAADNVCEEYFSSPSRVS